jgi:predicted alpha-1,6-mannanase (GH76 family)
MKTVNRYLLLLAIMLGGISLALPARPAAAFTASDADTAMNAFVSVFWDPNLKYFYTNSDRQIHSHAAGPQGGLYTDFWWEAQLWELVMDTYQRTNSPDYRQMLDDVYDGFVGQYPTFANDFNDDLGWWAQASVRAYEITGQSRYLNRAQSLFDSIWAYHDDTYGGGIWWRRSVRDQKNMATNGQAARTAAKLYRATGDQAYLQKAQALFSWFDSKLHENGHVYDHLEGAGSGTLVKWDFTYNFGTYIGAASELYVATGDSTYLTKAIAAANWATTYLTNGGTLLHEGVNDGGGFKMILCRYLNELVTRHGQSNYLSFLQRNATQAWNHRRTSDNLVGPDWSAPAPSSYIQSLTAATGIATLQFVAPDGHTGILAENGRYEAENAVRSNVGTESTQSGYSGRGYIAGWNQSNQSLTVNINVGAAGTYTINMRYAAGAGNASRKMIVNGSTVAHNLAFATTGSWASWNTVSLNNVTLNAGSNQIIIQIDPGAGNGEYLNLDYLDISAQSQGGTQYQAENGTLHNLSAEALYGGYTGTGYVAGWSSDGQWVDLFPNVAQAGRYTLTFRYAAAAGDASRYIYVNGSSVADNLSFPSTGAWSAWSTVTVSGVNLNSGANTVSVIFNSSKGSASYLNLDAMTVQ